MTKTDANPAALVPIDGRPPSQLSEAELADSYFEKKAKVDLFKPTKDRSEALAKEIRARFENKPAAQKFEIRGNRAVIQIGMKEQERSITSLFQLYKRSRLKIQEFLQKCKMTLSEAEDIPGSEHLIVMERTGSRDLKAVPLVEDKAA